METETELSEIINKAQSVNYIKLLKNTKNYNWEIKILSLDIDEIERLNNLMQSKFGDII